MKRFIIAISFLSLISACAGTPQQETERLREIATQVAVEELERVVPQSVEMGGKIGVGIKSGPRILDTKMGGVITIR